MEIVDPPAPSWVNATDGDYTNQSACPVEALTGVVTCEVWRGETDSVSNANLALPWLWPAAPRFHDDQTVLPSKLYYYWIRSKERLRYNGAYSVSDSGVRQLLPPASINATKDTYTDKVAVTWGAALACRQVIRFWRNTAGAVR